MESDSLAKVIEELKDRENQASSADWPGLAEEYAGWASRLDALREGLLRADDVLCEEMASKHGHSPGIIGNQIQRLRSIAGETEKGGTE